MKHFETGLRLKHSFSLFFLTVSFMSCSDHANNPYHEYAIDESVSLIEWKGYHKDESFNNGTIKVEGKLQANDSGQVSSGEFSMPLSSLINLNLPTAELKDQLIHHLQSTDFFDMAVYPTVAFKITSLVADDKGGDAYIATGDLTFLNKTNPITFPVSVIRNDSKLEIEGDASIDRLKWGMTYASDENATDGLYIKPGLDFHIKLSATRK